MDLESVYGTSGEVVFIPRARRVIKQAIIWGLFGLIGGWLSGRVAVQAFSGDSNPSTAPLAGKAIIAFPCFLFIFLIAAGNCINVFADRARYRLTVDDDGLFFGNREKPWQYAKWSEISTFRISGSLIADYTPSGIARVLGISIADLSQQKRVRMEFLVGASDFGLDAVDLCLELNRRRARALGTDELT